MKKFSLIFALFITGFTFSQNRIEDFQVTLPETKVPSSLYKTLKLVDARIDYDCLYVSFRYFVVKCWLSPLCLFTGPLDKMFVSRFAWGCVAILQPSKLYVHLDKMPQQV